MRILPTVAAALTACTLWAQSPLVTTFAGGTGLSGSGATVYFDLDVKVGVQWTGLDLALWAGTGTNVNIWTIPGTFVGNEGSSTGWTQVVTNEPIVAPVAAPTATNVTFGAPVPLNVGTYGVAVETIGDGQAYSLGTGVGNIWSGNNELDFLEGGSATIGFSGLQFSPRVFNGAFHYSPQAGFATATPFGMGCPSTSEYASFYEVNAPDLSGAPGSEVVVELVFDGIDGYSVNPGTSAFFTPLATDLALSVDGVASQILPFVLNHPTGATTEISICTNGYIWLNGTNTLGDFSPSTGELLGNDPRLCPLWTDLEPASAGGNGTIHFDVDPSGNTVYVTWLNCDQWGTGGLLQVTMQCAIHSSGNIEYRFDSNTVTASAICGYSPGNGSADPGNEDLTAGGIITNPDAIAVPMSLSTTRPVEGAAITVTTADIPVGAIFGAHVFSGTAFDPGIQPLPGLGDCFQHVGLNDVFTFLPIGGQNVTVYNIPASGFNGVVLQLQSVVLGVSFNALGAASSNGVTWVLDAN